MLFHREKNKGVYTLKKAIAVLLILLFSLCGCGKAYSEPASVEATASTAIVDEDFAISEIAKEWQTRNAPIFLRDDFYDPYAEQVGDEIRIDLDKAFAAIDLKVSFDESEETMIVTPVNELGVIMFQFSLHCVPFDEDKHFVCYEYYYEFMHTNSNPNEFLYYYSESSLPTDDSLYFIGRVGENVIYFPEDIFYEIDSTIGTMMTLTDDDTQPQDFTDLGPSHTL